MMNAVKNRAGDTDRIEGLARRMGAPELGQHAIVQGLDAERPRLTPAVR